MGAGAERSISGPLSVVLSADGAPMQPGRATRIVQAVASLVGDLHVSGRIHGRIEPASVTLGSDGEVSLGGALPEAALAGAPRPPELAAVPSLALSVDLETARGELAAAGVMMDPRRLDLYQLGELLCLLLTGGACGNYLRSPKAKGRVPGALRSVIERALGHNRADRFRNCQQFQAALEAAAAGASEADTPIGHDESPRNELPFSHLGHYTVVERIGRGGMGDVYKGYEESLDRTVAIKVLAPELVRDASYVRRFHSEATAAAKLDHPNVTQIHFIGQDDEHHFFAMQYVEGESLADRLADVGRLDIDAALDILKHCLSGLGAAHERGLVHRDVKPANILLEQSSRRAVLADFGLVKRLADETQLTVVGAVVGTADYLSPEQGRGDAADSRSDLYSLGVVAYRMLAGRLPFTAESATSMIFQHVYEQPTPFSAAAPDAPLPLAAIITKLMAKDPADRYQRASDVLADAEAFLAGEPVSALTDPPPDWELGSRGDGSRPSVDGADDVSGSSATASPAEVRDARAEAEEALAEADRRRDALREALRDSLRVIDMLKREGRGRDAGSEDEASDRPEAEILAAQVRRQIDARRREVAVIRHKLEGVSAAARQLRDRRDALSSRLRTTAGAASGRRWLRVAGIGLLLALGLVWGYQRLAESAPASLGGGSWRVASIGPQREVCEMLAAGETPGGLATDAIRFAAPRGGERRGANGFLLQAADGWAEHGTRWEFRYERSGSGKEIQIVHPWQEGHVLVTLGETVRVSTAGEWAKIGWVGEPGIALGKGDGFDGLFPLEADMVHVVASQLDAEGRYHLSIDGVLAAAGRVGGANPLNLAIPADAKPPGGPVYGPATFKGDRLPSVLATGQAGLIVGPRIRGSNVARHIYFAPYSAGPATGGAPGRTD